MTTKVVNRHHHVHFDQYIGRGTPFGNPYKLPPKATEEQRAACLVQFERYFFARVEEDPAFRHAVLSLRGKILGCSCVPRPCHGVTLAAWIDSQPPDAPLELLLDLDESEETPPWPEPSKDPQRALDALSLADCQSCELSKTRKNVVPGVGPAAADTMLVGEGPGENEDEQAEPFVGAAGQLLNRILKDAGMSRDGVFITNIVKCRPPGNRDPKPEEIRSCSIWLRSQIEVIQPKVFIAVGRFAASRLSGQFGAMGALLDRNLLYEGRVPVIPVYHPSYILRLLNGPKERAKMVYQDTVERFKQANLLAPTQPG